MKDLIQEYKKSIRALRKAKVAPLECNSMISDAEWTIKLMETGRIPGAKWTVARWSRDKREIPCDPLLMARYVQNREPISSAPGWMVELLNEILSSLTALEKDAYELVRGQGYSFCQAAQILHCSKGAVQSYIRRAEKKIQNVIIIRRKKEVCN